VKIPIRYEPGTLNEPVGKGRFAVVNVGNDAEVSDSRGFQCSCRFAAASIPKEGHRFNRGKKAFHWERDTNDLSAMVA
jgi:hypothetical protein